MKHVKSLMLAATLAVTTGLSAAAQGTGSEGYFQIYNDTANNILIGFYTNDGSGWSQNWIAGVEIAPGENATAEFTADTGSCDQVFSAGWLGSDNSEVIDDPISIDICGASNVYLGDNEISFD